MNYLAIRNSIIAAAFDSSQDATVKEWATQAYTDIWNEAEWLFKRVDEVDAALVAGNRALALPADFGYALRVYDHEGDELEEVSYDEYSRYMLPDRLDGVLGWPAIYARHAGGIHVGAVPDTNRTFKLSYRRAVSAYQVDGITIRVGGLSADTDIPLWPSQHHRILVHRGAMYGLGDENDVTAVNQEQLYELALKSMVADKQLLPPPKRGLQYGRVYW